MALKRINSFLNSEDLEEYVQLIDADGKKSLGMDSDEEDDGLDDDFVENSIEIYNAAFKWDGKQVHHQDPTLEIYACL